MTYHHKMLPTSATIAAYRSQPQPYSNYLHNLASLAVQLQNLKNDSWTLEEEVCEHYVYVYLDPRKPGRYTYRCPSGKVVRFKFQPFYVGKGKAKRLDAHLNHRHLKERSPKNATFKAILKEGFDPKDYCWCTKSRQTDWLARALEIDLIAGIGRRLDGGPLTNLSTGGEGSSGYTATPEQKRKQRIGMLGKKRNPEVGRKIGKALRGRTRTAEHCANLSASLKGRTYSEVEIQQFRESSATAKRVSIDGKVYPSGYEAARQLGVHAVTIQRWIRSSKKPDCFHI